MYPCHVFQASQLQLSIVGQWQIKHWDWGVTVLKFYKYLSIQYLPQCPCPLGDHFRMTPWMFTDRWMKKQKHLLYSFLPSHPSSFGFQVPTNFCPSEVKELGSMRHGMWLWVEASFETSYLWGSSEECSRHVFAISICVKTWWRICFFNLDCTNGKLSSV